ncbi:hypothetical protein, partial [Micromonospora tulbaghiae]|uniref:hypothetical protein n=1 Tax=Micromonospora tulbaghiae TaxID=479978 RepID=UPI0036B4D92F
HLPPAASSRSQDQPLRPASPDGALKMISCWSIKLKVSSRPKAIYYVQIEPELQEVFEESGRSGSRR